MQEEKLHDISVSTASGGIILSYREGSADMELRYSYAVQYEYAALSGSGSGSTADTALLDRDVCSAVEMILTCAFNESPLNSSNYRCPVEPDHIDDIKEQLSLAWAAKGLQLNALKVHSFFLDVQDAATVDKVRQMQRMTAENSAAAILLDMEKRIAAESMKQPAHFVPPAQAGTYGNKWVCGCGSANSSKFCPDCGAKRSYAKWLCSCGTENTGKFCTECGRKLQ